MSDILLQSVIAEARRLIGTPFHHQGRSAKGLDCLGLLLLAAYEAGVSLQGNPVQAIDVPNYSQKPDTVLLRTKLEAYLTPIALTEIRYGDVVLLKVLGSPQHLALISDYPMMGELGMIHAYAPAQKVVEHRYDASWRRDTYAAFRLA